MTRAAIHREPPNAQRPRRIVLTTIGSLGDLHPYVALARGLKARGHEPILATSGIHRARIERQGLAYFPVRPHLHEFEQDYDAFRRYMDRKSGTQAIFRELFLPSLRSSFDDLIQAVDGADLLISHTVAFAAPLVAEITQIPWLSATLQPLSFPSRYQGFVPAEMPWFRHLKPVWPWVHRPIIQVGRTRLRRWTEPVGALRRELGLPEGGDALFEGSHAPGGVLALFSSAFAARQPDWPAQVVVTGFPFLDESRDTELSPETREFLAQGDPPLVFTLGSSAVMDAGRFYHESLEAARRLKRRAVLLVGNDPRNQPPGAIGGDVLVIPYAPHADLFRRAAAIVHQGGVGTTAQALRSGRPMLVVPWAHDQFDNADRVCRLGVSRTLYRQHYSSRTVATNLAALLDNPTTVARSEAIGQRIQSEDGIAVACDVIESFLAGVPIVSKN